MASDDADYGDDELDNLEHTFLTFQVGGEEYAVPVATVTEIVRLQKTYVVPDVPPYIRGVINLRGKVIPLLDVRSRFGLADAAYTDRTVVVVIELGDATTGLVVDGVSDVTEIPPDRIESHSGLRAAAGSSMVKGMGRRDDRVSFVLDIDSLIQTSSIRAAGDAVRS